MIYKIILSNTKDTIPVSDEELPSVVKAMQAGGNIIVTKEGVFNPSFYVTIVPDHEASRFEAEHKLIDNSKPYLASPFAKLLSAKMDMKQIN